MKTLYIIKKIGKNTQSQYFKMRKFLFCLVFTLLWSTTGHTKKISFYDLKIGDKITDHFTYRQIDQNYTPGQPAPSGEIVYGKDKIYSYITIVNDDQIFIEDFSKSGIQIYYENRTDKIVAIGNVETSLNLNKCLARRDKEALKYKKKKLISNLFNENKDTYQFPDGMVDHFISYQGKDRDFSFRCYAYPDGYVNFRSDVYLIKFNDYVFKKFSE